MVKTADTVPSWLFLIRQLPHGNSYTWPHDKWLHITDTNEARSAQQVKQGA